MNPVEDLIQLFENYERCVSEIYRKFRWLFPDQSELFSQLSEEEARHGDMYKLLQEHMVPAEALKTADFAVSSLIMGYILKREEDYFSRIDELRPTLLMALMKSYEIENTLADKEIYRFFLSRKESKLYRELNKHIVSETEHRGKIIKALEIYSQT